MVQVKVKKLSAEAKMPTKGTAGAAAWDLYAIGERFDAEGRYLEYSTGIAVEIPAGYVGKVHPRSSNRNKDIVFPHSVGVIDSDYRGEVTVIFKSLLNAGARKYKVGERVAQLIIEKLPDVELVEASELSDTARGTGGYGSTGS